MLRFPYHTKSALAKLKCLGAGFLYGGGCSQPPHYEVLNGGEVEHYCETCFRDSIYELVIGNDDVSFSTSIHDTDAQRWRTLEIPLAYKRSTIKELNRLARDFADGITPTTI